MCVNFEIGVARISRFQQFLAMNDGEDWSEILTDHPIFSLPDSFSGPSAQRESSLELSTSNLSNFTHLDPTQDGPTPSGRRQVMVLKDADLIVASGKEIRITSLGESKLSKSHKKTYKVWWTPYVSTLHVNIGIHRRYILPMFNSRYTNYH